MLRTTLYICLPVFLGVLVAIGCTPSSQDHTVAGNEPAIPLDDNTAVIFLTGNTLSTLQPCGCSADQLGGFDRRPAVIDTVPKDRRAVIDTGNMLMRNSEQDNIKLSIIMQALSMLKYDLVRLSGGDFATLDELGLTGDMPFPVISTAPGAAATWSKTLRIGDRDLKINVATATEDTEDLDSLAEAFEGDLSVNILVVDACNEEFVDRIADVDTVDVVVCPTDADEPRIVDKDRTKPLLISVGRLGKYFGKLTVQLSLSDEVTLHYDKVPVSKNLAPDDSLVQLYKDYQMIVKEEGLLAKTIKTPLPDGLKYLGSENCHSCHGYEHDEWAKRRHGHAYQSLVNVGSQYDPECIGCHVVGFGYESGFISEKSPKDLRNVGCEVCHGPGSGHMKAVTTGAVGWGISDVVTACVQCHTTDRSPGYSGHEKEYLQKIVHWREPKGKKDVKK